MPEGHVATQQREHEFVSLFRHRASFLVSCQLPTSKRRWPKIRIARAKSTRSRTLRNLRKRGKRRKRRKLKLSNQKRRRHAHKINQLGAVCEQIKTVLGTGAATAKRMFVFVVLLNYMVLLLLPDRFHSIFPRMHVCERQRRVCVRAPCLHASFRIGEFSRRNSCTFRPER